MIMYIHLLFKAECVPCLYNYTKQVMWLLHRPKTNTIARDLTKEQKELTQAAHKAIIK